MFSVNSTQASKVVNGLAAGSLNVVWDSKDSISLVSGQPLYVSGTLTGGLPDAGSADQGYPLELIIQYNAKNREDPTSNLQQHKVILFPGNGRCNFGVCLPCAETRTEENLRTDIIVRNQSGNPVGGMSGLVSLNVRNGIGPNYINNVWSYYSGSISGTNVFARFWGTAESLGSFSAFVRNDATAGAVNIEGTSYVPGLYGGPHIAEGLLSTTAAASGGTYDAGFTSQRTEFPGLYLAYSSAPTGGACHATGKV